MDTMALAMSARPSVACVWTVAVEVVMVVVAVCGGPKMHDGGRSGVRKDGPTVSQRPERDKKRLSHQCVCSNQPFNFLQLKFSTILVVRRMRMCMRCAVL
jgi:hypothetical protein